MLILMAAGAPARGQEEVTILSEPTIVLDTAGLALDDIEIFLDDALVNAFAGEVDGQAVLTLPFTKSPDVFRIEVRKADTGDLVSANRYRFAAGGFFDQQEFEVDVLETVTWTAASNISPRPVEFESRDLGHDFQGRAGFTGVRGSWSIGAEGALQGTDDDSATLRPGGSKLDLQQGRVFTAFSDNVVQARLEAIDVYVPGNNLLVNQGYQSRGFALNTIWFEERATINAASTFGTDIVGFQRGFGQRDDSHRRVVDLGLDLVRSELLDISLTGSFLWAERPPADNFGIAEITEGETNRVFGTGLKLDLFQGRIRTASDLAWSRYNNPAELDPFAISLTGLADIGTTTGMAQHHRVDATLWEGEDLSITAYSVYSRVDQLYRSVQAFPGADHETIEFGGAIGLGPVRIGFSRNVFENNIDDLATFLTTRQATNAGTISLDLEAYRQTSDETEAAWLRRLIPSSVTLTGTEIRIDGQNTAVILANPALFYTLAAIPKQVTRFANLGFSWTWANAATALNFSTNRLDNRQIGLKTADTVDDGVNVSQIFFGDIWQIAGYLIATRTRNEEVTSASTRNFLATGLSVSLTPEGWPDFTGNFDWQRDLTDFLVAGTESLATTRSFGATLDFSKYLPSYFLEPLGRVQPFITASGQYQKTNFRDPFFGATSQSNYSFIISGGVQF